jgi:rhamnosyltransferase
MGRKVAVILASYNGEKYIVEQISSIISQIGIDLSIFVTDDDSIDNTVEIIKNNFPIIEIKINRPGSGSAANNFLGFISTFRNIDDFDYFAFSDQDDIWKEDKLYSAINKLKENKAELYCSNLERWDYLQNTTTIIKKDYPQKKYDYLFEGGSAGCTYVFSSKMCKSIKSNMKYISKEYSESPFFSHDWLIYAIARHHKYKVFIDSKSYMLYRIHDNNVHGKLNEYSFGAAKKRLDMIKKGWYTEHAKGISTLLDRDSSEFNIYKLYCKNFYTRFFVLLKYNFTLMRSKFKFMQFLIVSLLFVRSINKKDFDRFF